jgi:hypothetical protein
LTHPYPSEEGSRAIGRVLTESKAVEKGREGLSIVESSDLKEAKTLRFQVFLVVGRSKLRNLESNVG